MLEIFKLISDYPNYEVSNLGNVRNKKTGRVLKPRFINGGYYSVNLSKLGVRKNNLIHRLVADAFIPNPENKRTINHINGIKTDNRLANLEWSTHSENISHAYKVGLRQPITPSLKNNFIQKRTKCRCIETGEIFSSQLSASKYFGCSPTLIHHSIHKGYTILKKYHFELIQS